MDIEKNELGPRRIPAPREYEAFAPGSLPSGQMALVRAIQERFLRTFAEALSARLELPVTAQLSAAGPHCLREFLDSGDQGGCLLTLAAEPVNEHAFAALSPGLVAHLLRLLLGAPHTSEETRAVTEIELHILREIFDMLSRELSAAWQSAGTGFRWISTSVPETDDTSGTLLVFEYRLELDDGPQTMQVAVPALMARLASLYSIPDAPAEQDSAVREMILEALRRAHVTVEAVLAGSKLRMGDLLAMEPGHTLMLTQPAGSPMECRINGKAKFRGEWVSRGARQAIELL